jgi:hypothetical protein
VTGWRPSGVAEDLEALPNGNPQSQVILTGRVSINNPPPARLHKFRRQPSKARSADLANGHIRSILKLPCNDISNFFADAFSPEIPLCWRRAPTFCKAPLKKSTSTVLSASNRFSLVISHEVSIRGDFLSTLYLRLGYPVVPTDTATCTADCGLSRVPGIALLCCRMHSSARQLGGGISRCIALSFSFCSSFPAKRVL